MCLGPFLNNVAAFRFFFLFVERKGRNSSCILWNKSQDYEVKFTLTDHFLLKGFAQLDS